MATVGLDIGTNSIKVCEVRKRRGCFVLTRMGNRPTPIGAVREGVIVQPSAVAAEVTKLLHELKLKPKKVCTAVAGQSVVVRTLHLPAMTPTELQEAVKWEAQSQLPFSLDTGVYDFDVVEQGLDPETGRDQITVVLVGARRQIIDSFVETLKLCKAAPRIIDVQPFALLRAIGAGEVGFGQEPEVEGDAVAGLESGQAVGAVGSSSSPKDSTASTWDSPTQSGGFLRSGIGPGEFWSDESARLELPDEQTLEQMDIETLRRVASSLDPGEGIVDESGGQARSGGRRADSPGSPGSVSVLDTPARICAPTGLRSGSGERGAAPSASSGDAQTPFANLGGLGTFGEQQDGAISETEHGVRRGTASAPSALSPSHETSVAQSVPLREPGVAGSTSSPLRRGQAEPAHTVAILDIGAGTTDMVVIVGETLKFTRILPIGGNAITEVISAELGCGAEEAERLKRNTDWVLGMDLESGGQAEPAVVAAIGDVIDGLMREIRRSVDFYNLEHRTAPIEYMILSGGGSRLAGLRDYLSVQLGIPVGYCHPYARVHVDPRAASQDMLQSAAPIMAVSIGLALRGEEER